jgi:L-cysteine:1D-myo-inositol 2-amino-2-deoxy-alpha-D-glucopyranoside ligase
MELRSTGDAQARPFLAGHTIRFYVCGITPYDATHLGHAFLYTVFDSLIRYLEHAGHVVVYARNITDVDDDILRRARELGERYDVIADREVARFDQAMELLGNREPDIIPRPSTDIPAIQMAVSGLVANGHAYALEDGRVYFDVATSDRFGRHGGLDQATMLQQFAEKGGDPEAPGKHNALDFLLWQPSAPDEPSWASPWGDGRPGWHIECSAMIMEHLGSAIDLHAGGSDLIFPHHEAEILQAECLTGQTPFVRFWLNCGMVALDGAKMSKSLGNLVLASDLLERYEAEALRRMLLAHHYREDWSYRENELIESGGWWRSWRDAASGDGERPEFEAAFHAAMNDDLDTPAAIRAVDGAAEAGAGCTVRTLAGILGFTF